MFRPVPSSPMLKALSSIVASLAIVMMGSSALAASSKDRSSHERTETRPAGLNGDVAAGRQIFAARCSACHGADAEGGVVAPTLNRVFGEAAARSKFARYSNALKTSGLVWTPVNLDGFLASPGKLVPGSTMMTVVSNPSDRINLIAYLASLNVETNPKQRH